MEVRLTAIADPARNGQQELDARFIGKLGQPDVILPGVLPALGHLRH